MSLNEVKVKSFITASHRYHNSSDLCSNGCATRVAEGCREDITRYGCG